MLRKGAPPARIGRFPRDVVTHTPFVSLVLLLIVLWLLFAAGLYLAERGIPGTTIHAYGEALYWGVAAFSTAGTADTPLIGTRRLIGGFWIVIGSVLFFGAILATVTGCCMRPLQRPHQRIIDTIDTTPNNSTSSHRTNSIS